MSDWLSPRLPTFHGLHGGPTGWRVRLYEFRAAGAPDSITASEMADQCLESPVLDDLSDEFEYFRAGMMFCHFGRRGVTASIYHLGRWEDMPEIFHTGWYSYGYETIELELLDHREPIACLHDIPLVAYEFECFRNVVEAAIRAEGELSWPVCTDAYLSASRFGDSA